VGLWKLNVSQLGLSGLIPWQDLHVLIRHAQEVPDVRPPVTAEEGLGLARLVVANPEPGRAERAVLFMQLPRRLGEGGFVLRGGGGGHDVDDLGLCEVFAEGLGHVGGNADVDVFDEAIVPQREIGEFIDFRREVVFDVDHAALRL
jgi:hypothetical protein